ncbi:MAG: hypothetical protein L3J39_18485 [Verrucomicrobiales bacterium]|nr:hypothetical protein [Verrucomicrobiales bacterium]
MGAENNTMQPRKIENYCVPDVIGKCISGITRGDFMLDGKVNDEDFGPLQLEFGDGSALAVFLMPDGESVAFTELKKPKGTIHDEATAWPCVDLGNGSPFSKAIGLSIESVQSLIFGMRGQNDWVICGYVFRLSGGHMISYYNEGDFAKIYFDHISTMDLDGFVMELYP